MASNQYSENLFTAIEVIANSIVNKQGFDKTIVCTIINDSDRREGKYIASNGTTEFEAYSEITSYRNNTQVYVLIPGNDFKQQKKITGKYIDNNDLSYVQTSPFDNMIDITGNMLSGVISQGLLANNPDKKEILLQAIICGDGAQNYTRLGLSAEFATRLDGLNVRSGEYGLRLQINGEYVSGEQVEKNFYLKSSDMYGDIYNFNNYFKQEISFKIPNEFNKIKTISLYFYQNNDFKDQNGNPVPHKDSFDGLYLDNLLVKDPYLFFGYALEDVKDGGVFIYSFNGESYVEGNKNNKKTIYLRWLRKDSDGTIELIDSLDGGQSVNWYRYTLEEGLTDDLAGSFWKQIASNTFEYQLDPDINLATESIKVIIRDGEELYYSNVLEFYNEKEVPNQATIDLIQGLEILCEGDTLGGVFRLYGEDGVLVNKSEADKKRSFKANYTLVEDGKGDSFGDGESITWFFPKHSTMIQTPLAGIEYDLNNGDIFTENETKYVITRLKKGDTLNVEQPYRINQYFTPNYYNNEIKCAVMKNNREYKASRTLTFAQTGTFGTDYTFVLSFQNGINALSTKSRTSVCAKLYDGNNKEVNLEGKEIFWSWYLNDGRITLINTKTFQCELIFKGDSIDPNGTSNILKASVITNDGVNLSAFLPIPISLNLDEYHRLEGPATVIYNYKGDNCTYIRLPYKLYDKDGKEIVGKYTITEGNYYPKLNENNFLVPQNLFISNNSYNIVLNCSVDNKIVWQQPIYIGQNRYPSPMLNNWDGKLTLNEENDTILSTMVGAGRKETDNSFSGVLMGDIQTGTGNDIIDTIGLYGYHHGAQSFGFKVDGTAFIGKSGTGRIEFDGTKGTITSREYKENGSGTILDFDDGFLLLRNEDKTFVRLSESTPYFQVNDGKKNLIEIANSTYYLQSSNFNNTNEESLGGTKIDLNNGKITSYNFEIKDIKGNLLFHIDNDDYYLQSSNFNSILKTGSKIDIGNGIITSYNFSLDAGDGNSGIQINSNGEPYLRIKNENNILIEASKENLYLQSNGYKEGTQGIKFNLAKGSLNAYGNFLLQASGSYEGRGSMLTLNSVANVYQMEVTYLNNSSGTHMGLGGLLVGTSGSSSEDCLIESNGTSYVGYGSIYAANIYATTFHGNATSATTAGYATTAGTAAKANGLSEGVTLNSDNISYGGRNTSVSWKLDSLQTQIDNIRASISTPDLSAYVTRSEYSGHTHPVYLATLNTGTPG